MYAFVTLALAAASVLARPHNLQVRDGPTSTASAIVSCPGAPAIPDGAVPGDACGSDSTAPIDDSTAPEPSSSPLAARAVASRRSKSKRGGFSTCKVVALNDYKSSALTGLQDIAAKNWGSDFKVVVNPSDLPGSPLHFCYSSDTVPAAFDSPPTCSSAMNNIAGDVTNGAADVTLSVLQGIVSTHEVTVEKAVSLSTATEVGFTLGVPDIADVSIKETVTFTGTSTKGDTQSTAINRQTTETVVAHATKPGPCNIQLNVTSCTASASATVPGFYTGFVWFNYGKRKDGHFKWSLNVDLLPADQRSDNMTVTDKISSNINGKFTSDCH